MGTQRPPSAQWTATAAGCALLMAGDGTGLRVTAGTLGRIVDYKIKDANHMGAAMAPAVESTIYAHLDEDVYKRQAHDDIEAVICNNDEMALGAIEALKAGGYLVDGGTFIPVVGVDCNEEAQLAIEEGTMYASVFNDAKSQADAVVKLCKLIADGEEPTSENLGYTLDGQYVWIPYVPVTIDNLDTIG